MKGFDRPLSEYLPLDDWGATVAPKDIQIDWNIPGMPINTGREGTLGCLLH